MNDLALMPDWSALFLGLFAIFAGIGELRRPGHWRHMMEEIAASPTLQTLTALVELLVGSVIYMLNPWASPDWLARVMNVIGALICIEALLILSFSDVYMVVLRQRMGPLAKLWAWVSILFGLALIALAQPGFMNA